MWLYLCGKLFPTFRRTVLSSCSGITASWTLKPATQHHSLEDRSIHLHRCGNLKTNKLSFIVLLWGGKRFYFFLFFSVWISVRLPYRNWRGQTKQVIICHLLTHFICVRRWRNWLFVSCWQHSAKTSVRLTKMSVWQFVACFSFCRNISSLVSFLHFELFFGPLCSMG